MKEKKSVKKNFIYNLIYQVFLIIVPVVVTPYVSRVLGAAQIGQYSYSYSIVSYFVLFAALGFSFYAQREVAKYQDDKYEQSKIFWEICIVRLISTLIAFFALIGISFIPFFNDYRILLLILSLNVFATCIDTTFIFTGNEDFKQIAIRNFIAKTIVIASIFIFVKSTNDLWIYTLIQGLSPIVSSLLMIPFLKKYLVKVSYKELKPTKHFVPCIKLFIPTIAISIYTMLDKTMIGSMIQGEITVIEDGVEVVKKLSDVESGYYNQAEKIVKVLITIVSALGTVMIPRNSYFFAKGDVISAKKNVMTGLRFAYLLAFPLMFGVIAVSCNFSPWFFGDGYEKVPFLMQVFSPLILAIGLNTVFGNQYLIPSSRDNQYTISVVIGAGTNLILNAILISFYGSVGAAISTVCAEFIILFVQLFFLRKDITLLSVISSGWKYFVAGIVMFIPCYIVGLKLSSSILNTLIIVAIGIFAYGIMLLILKDEFIYSILGKLKRKKNNNEK